MKFNEKRIIATNSVLFLYEILSTLHSSSIFFQLSFFISLSDDVELNVKKKFYLHSYSFLGVNKTLIYHHQEEREDDLIFVLLSSM